MWAPQNGSHRRVHLQIKRLFVLNEENTVIGALSYPRFFGVIFNLRAEEEEVEIVPTQPTVRPSTETEAKRGAANGQPLSPSPILQPTTRENGSELKATDKERTHEEEEEQETKPKRRAVATKAIRKRSQKENTPRKHKLAKRLRGTTSLPANTLTTGNTQTCSSTET
jgi:type IV secretory pathway VirB10-like protein